MDLSADLPTAADPPTQLLPMLTLAEAHDVLAAVLDGGEVDEQLAYCLLSNLAARVPSRDAARGSGVSDAEA